MTTMPKDFADDLVRQMGADAFLKKLNEVPVSQPAPQFTSRVIGTVPGTPYESIQPPTWKQKKEID